MFSDWLSRNDLQPISGENRGRWSFSSQNGGRRSDMDNKAEKMEREGVTDGEAGNGLMEQIQPRQDDY